MSLPKKRPWEGERQEVNPADLADQLQGCTDFLFSNLMSESPKLNPPSPNVPGLCISSLPEKLLRKKNSTKGSAVLLVCWPLQAARDHGRWWREAHSCRKPFMQDSLNGPRGSFKSSPWLSGEPEIPTRPMHGDKWVEGFEGTIRRPCWPTCHTYPTNIDFPYSGLIRTHFQVIGILVDC